MTSPSDKKRCALDDMNGVGIELADDARFGLVFAEAEHAEAGDENDGRAGIAEGRRVGRGEVVVVGAVLLAIFGQRSIDLRFEIGDAAASSAMGQTWGESWCG